MNVFIIINFDDELIVPLSNHIIVTMVQSLIGARDYVVIVSNSFAFINLAVASTAYRIKKSVATLGPVKLYVVLVTLQIKTTS